MRLSLHASLALLLIGGSLRAQEVRRADSLTPEDFGATKFLFEAAPHEKQVVVFRQDEYLDGKLRSRFERIFNPSKPGEKDTEYVLLIDRGFFSDQFSRGPYVVQTRTGSIKVDSSKLVSTAWDNTGKVSGKPVEAKVIFNTTHDGKTSERKFVYSIFIEGYDSVKQRHSKLPEQSDGTGWTYADSVEP
jgi:hypothetical protein